MDYTAATVTGQTLGKVEGLKYTSITERHAEARRERAMTMLIADNSKRDQIHQALNLRRSESLTDILLDLGGDYVVSIEDSARPEEDELRVHYRTVLRGHGSSWIHATAESAILTLIAERADNSGDAHTAAVYAGRVLGL